MHRIHARSGGLPAEKTGMGMCKSVNEDMSQKDPGNKYNYIHVYIYIIRDLYVCYGLSSKV